MNTKSSNKIVGKKTYFIVFAICACIFLTLAIVFTAAYKPFAFLNLEAATKKIPHRPRLITTCVFYLLSAFCVGMMVVEVRNNSKKMPIANRRRTVAEKALFVGVFIFFTLFSALFLYFLAWGFLSSLKGSVEFSINMSGLPKDWLFENYKTAFNELEHNGVGVLGMMGNSLYFAIASSLLDIFFHCCTGYIFAKYRFKGKSLVFSIVIFTMVIPVFGTLAPLYKLIYDLGITDSYLYVIICTSGFGGKFLVTYAFFKALDWSYAEAAMMDGAGHIRIFLTIMLPLATPIIVAYFILGFIASWNDYMTAMLYLKTLPTLATGLYYYRQEAEHLADYPLYFAGVFMSILPILIIFTLFADKIMNSLVIGGLKG